MDKKTAIESINKMIKRLSDEKQFPILVEKGEFIQPPVVIEVTDIKIIPVSFRIPSERGSEGIETFYFELEIENVGVLNIFDSSYESEVFFGSFQCYFEDFEALIVERDPSDSVTQEKIENYLNQLDFSEMLTQQPPDEFMKYFNEEVEKIKSEIENKVSSYYGLNSEEVSVELNGPYILIKIKGTQVPLILPAQNYFLL